MTHGISSKGPLVMSSSQAVHEALSLDYLAGQGLVSLFTILQKLNARRFTARYGPAHRVVWEGFSRKVDPSPDHPFVRLKNLS